MYVAERGLKTGPEVLDKKVFYKLCMYVCMYRTRVHTYISSSSRVRVLPWESLLCYRRPNSSQKAFENQEKKEGGRGGKESQKAESGLWEIKKNRHLIKLTLSFSAMHYDALTTYRAHTCLYRPEVGHTYIYIYNTDSIQRRHGKHVLFIQNCSSVLNSVFVSVKIRKKNKKNKKKLPSCEKLYQVLYPILRLSNKETRC